MRLVWLLILFPVVAFSQALKPNIVTTNTTAYVLTLMTNAAGGSVSSLAGGLTNGSYYVLADPTVGWLFYANSSSGQEISGSGWYVKSNGDADFSGTLSATGLVGDTVTVPGTTTPPALAQFGGELWTDGTNLCVVLQNAGGGKTTNKVTLSAWP